MDHSSHALDPSLEAAKLSRIYRQMKLIRAFEERVYYMFLEGILPGTIHQYQGQEAAAVGVCEALGPSDVITSTHRPHGHAIAKGLPLRDFMAELFAKTSGCCAGKGGSMHVGDMAVGMLPAIPIVAAGIPIATGMALGFKMRREPRVAACFFGDGGSNNGVFHEGINMAAVWQLPVVFVCENNVYGASTAIESMMKAPSIAARASAYGIPGTIVDGTDVLAVFNATSQAVAAARAGRGPTLLEILCYRFCGHSRSDPGNYRPSGELEKWKERDPILVLRQRLAASALWTDQDEAYLDQAIESEIEEAVSFARASADPLPEDCLTGVYANE